MRGQIERLLEDDEQFLWKKEDYPSYIDDVFARAPDAVQLLPLFFRRIRSYGSASGRPAAGGWWSGTTPSGCARTPPRYTGRCWAWRGSRHVRGARS